MGFDDRSYAAPVQRPSRFEGAPVTKALLWINIAIFVVDYFFLKSPKEHFPPLQQVGAFILNPDMSLGEPWRFLTYQFFHANLGHLFSNMIGLFVFGPMVERWWGSKPFAGFYFICGCIGALFFVLLASVGLLSPGGWLIGASGSLLGVLIAAARIAPNQRVMLLFPPIPLKLRTLAIAFLVFSVFTIMTRGNNAGGEACHLGGALAGYLFMQFPQSLAWLKNSQPIAQRARRPKPRKPYQPSTPPKLRPRPETLSTEREIDEILEKVHQKGLQSLTEREKQVLKNASKRS